MNWLNNLRVTRHLRTSGYRTALAELPPGLEAAWRDGASTEFPGIPRDALFFVRAAEGLLGFLDVTTQGGPCALPSLAADSVWHAWLRHDPEGLEHFCRRHFGAAVPHLEADRLDQGALVRTLVACRTQEGIPAYGPALPRLFTLDARLRMPRGHGYATQHGEVAYTRLDATGRRLRTARPQPELSLAALLAAGYITEETHSEALRRRQDGGDGYVASTNSDCGSSGDCGDGGGGCGGGCGGGD